MSSAAKRDPGSPTVLHLTLTSAKGGCERDCELFIRQAPDLRHVVATLDQTGVMNSRWVAEGAEVRFLPILRAGRIGYFKGLRRHVGEIGARHAIVWAPIRIALTLGAMNGRVQTVLVHAGNPQPRRPLRDLAMSYAGAMLGQPMRTAIVACSDYVAESYQANPNLRRFPCFTHLNPIELPPFAIDPPRPLDPTSTVRLGMVARLDRIKDHPTTLKAFASIRSQFPRATLELAGDGVLRPSLEELARDLGIGDAVEFLGFVPDVNELFRRWDLYLYATTRWEGLGNALAEAMAAGLPCIASDLPMIRELAGSADNIRFVPPGDPQAMAAGAVALLKDVEARKALGASARRRIASRFDPTRAVKFYRKLLGV